MRRAAGLIDLKEIVMKKIVLLAGALAVLPLIGAPAHADGPWCSYYSGRGSGSNCGFYSYEQCRANIQGVGGICSPNPFLPRRADHRRKRHYDW
jgi:hypothetical protein